MVTVQSSNKSSTFLQVHNLSSSVAIIDSILVNIDWRLSKKGDSIARGINQGASRADFSFIAVVMVIPMRVLMEVITPAAAANCR